LQKEVYEAGLAMIKPGATFGALADYINGIGANRGMKTVMQLHGCGYGDDGPLFSTRARGERARDLPMKAGNVFIWRPLAMSADEKIRFSWGGPALVSENGCEALFRHEHGMVEVA
jgi:methionine aminopeptidase